MEVGCSGVRTTSGATWGDSASSHHGHIYDHNHVIPFDRLTSQQRDKDDYDCVEFLERLGDGGGHKWLLVSPQMISEDF